MRRLLPFFLAVLLFALPASGVSVFLVPSITQPSVLTVRATSDLFTHALSNLDPRVVPFVESDSVVHGGASASSSYDLSNAGFRITFDHQRPAGNYSFAESTGSLLFRVDADVVYEASGVYSAIDPDGRAVALRMSLYDVTDGEYVFYSYQRSESTPNESFVLGGNGGDQVTSPNEGSLTGDLLGGHRYRLEYGVAIGNGTLADSQQPSSATGFIQLAFVPEPATGALLALGMAFLAGGRRNRE